MKFVLNPKVVSLVLLAIVGYLAYLPGPSATELERLKSAFNFEVIRLQDGDGPFKSEGSHLFMSTNLHHVENFLVSFIPTGATFTDLDSNGLFDEFCTADPFSSRVRIFPAPTRQEPFEPFEVPMPEGFDRGTARPTGCLSCDFDQDGTNDLLVHFWGRSPVLVFNADTDGRLEPGDFEAAEFVSPPQVWYTHSASTGDIDGDGLLDLVFAEYMDGAMRMVNGNRPGPAQLFQGMGKALNGGTNRLFLGVGGGDQAHLFVEAPGVFDGENGGTQWTIAVGVADLDGDLLPEVIFGNDHSEDRFLHNRSTPGKPSFAPLTTRRGFFTPRSKALGKDAWHAMGVDIADLNKDGRLDIAISNFTANYLFSQNHYILLNTGEKERMKAGVLPFRDVSESWGLARTSAIPWDIRTADFNNDGNLEVFFSTGMRRGTVNRLPEVVEMGLMNDVAMQIPWAWQHFPPDSDLTGQAHNHFFARGSDGRYYDIGAALGFREADVTRGIATADTDADGLIDYLATNHNQAPSTFYHNQVRNDAQFLGLSLKLAYDSTTPERVVATKGLAVDHRQVKCRDAIGAQAVVSLPDGRKRIGYIDGGTGVGGKKMPAIHLGLGDIEKDAPLKVTLEWRDLTGEPHKHHLSLAPGWHTVWLGHFEKNSKSPEPTQYQEL